MLLSAEFQTEHLVLVPVWNSAKRSNTSKPIRKISFPDEVSFEDLLPLLYPSFLFLAFTRERGLAFFKNRISLKRLVTLKQSWFGLKTWFLNDNTILFLFTSIEIHNKRFRIDSRQNRPRVGGNGQTTNKVILRFIKGKNFEEWNLNSFKNSRKFDSSPGMPIFVDLGLIVSPATSSGENQC